MHDIAGGATTNTAGAHGNPGEMYALAGVLRVTADQINDAARRIPKVVREVDAHGNFIATYRGDASAAQRRAGAAAAKLHAAADALETAAPRVAAANEHDQRLAAKKAAERRDAARR